MTDQGERRVVLVGAPRGNAERRLARPGLGVALRVREAAWQEVRRVVLEAERP